MPNFKKYTVQRTFESLILNTYQSFLVDKCNFDDFCEN